MVKETEEYNKALLQLGSDISKAINKYLKGGYINFAAIIGILEDMKINVRDIMRGLKPRERVTFQKRPPEYIG